MSVSYEEGKEALSAPVAMAQTRSGALGAFGVDVVAIAETQGASMTVNLRPIMDFVEAVGAAHDAQSFYAASLRELTALFPSDHVFWTRTDFGKASAYVKTENDDTAQLEGALGLFGPEHPAIRTYVADPLDLAPRRMSDVCSLADWHSTALYNECFRDFGQAHQLSMVVSVDPAGVGVGWTVTRSGSDYSQSDVELAGRLLPALHALELSYSAPMAAGVQTSVEPTRVQLSCREREVLEALSTGLTAASIGRRLGITERTVRKHLDAIYRKLDCSDRLMAVKQAIERGLL